MRAVRGRIRAASGLRHPLALFIGLAGLSGGSPKSARAGTAFEPIEDGIEVSTPSCLDRSVLAQQIAIWIRSSTMDSAIRVMVLGDSSQEVVFQILRDGRIIGRRTYATRGMPCANVTALLSLAIAMALGGERAAGLDPAPVVERPVVPPQPSVVVWGPQENVSSPVEPPPPPPSPASSLFSAEVTGAVVVGLFPKAAFLGGAWLGFAPSSHFFVRLGAFSSAAVAPAAAEGGSASLSLFAGEIAPCFAMPLAMLTGRACLGFAGGQITGEGSGYSVPASARLLWLAATARFEVDFRLSAAFALATFLEEAFSLPDAPELTVSQEQRGTTSALPVWTFGSGFSAGVGPVVHFP